MAKRLCDKTLQFLDSLDWALREEGEVGCVVSNYIQRIKRRNYPLTEDGIDRVLKKYEKQGWPADELSAARTVCKGILDLNEIYSG